MKNRKYLRQLFLLGIYSTFTMLLLCGCKNSETNPIETNDTVIVINDENSNYLKKQDAGSSLDTEEDAIAPESVAFPRLI